MKSSFYRFRCVPLALLISASAHGADVDRRRELFPGCSRRAHRRCRPAKSR